MKFRVIFDGTEYVGQQQDGNVWRDCVSSESHQQCLYSLQRIANEECGVSTKPLNVLEEWEQ